MNEGSYVIVNAFFCLRTTEDVDTSRRRHLLFADPSHAINYSSHAGV